MLISLALHVDCILDNYTGYPKQAQEVQEKEEGEEEGGEGGTVGVMIIRLMLNASLINTIPENGKFLFILYGSKSSRARQSEGARVRGRQMMWHLYLCMSRRS